jgi:hypothetical protein
MTNDDQLPLLIEIDDDQPAENAGRWALHLMILFEIRPKIDGRNDKI